MNKTNFYQGSMSVQLFESSVAGVVLRVLDRVGLLGGEVGGDPGVGVHAGLDGEVLELEGQARGLDLVVPSGVRLQEGRVQDDGLVDPLELPGEFVGLEVPVSDLLEQLGLRLVQSDLGEPAPGSGHVRVHVDVDGSHASVLLLMLLFLPPVCLFRDPFCVSR